MLFDEDDIVFANLSGGEFEELCFDLLHRLGFHSLEWRQGGADQGRDIEAAYTVTNPLTGDYSETWFIECKNTARGVAVRDLNEKIAWADAELPRHFALITSAYVTDDARRWLKNIGPNKAYRIHLIEGKKLKRAILGFPDITERYFFDRYRRLLQDSIRRWTVSEVLPSPQELYIFSRNLKPDKLDLHSAAFLWLSEEIQLDRVSDWCEENDVEDFHVEGLEDKIVSAAVRSEAPLLAGYADIMVRDSSSRVFAWRYRLVDGQLVGPGEIQVDEALEGRKEEIAGMHTYRQLAAQLIVGDGERLNSALYCHTFNGRHTTYLEALLVDDPRQGFKMRAIGVDCDFVADQARALSFLSKQSARSTKAGA